MALATLLLGCGGAADKPPPALDRVALVPRAAAGDEVVATVDGRPIHASQVAAQARAAGVDARRALADLIDAEVLAGEAARRGLDRDRLVVEAAKAAAVRALLQRVFEPMVRPEQIPDRAVRRYYNANVNLFDHSEYVDCWHILAPAREEAGEQKRQAARQVAEELVRRAREVRSLDAFKALSQTVAPPPGEALKLERIVTARDGWVEKPFSYAAFEVKPGTSSGVVETSYGYHVIYVVRFLPEQHLTLAQADARIRPTLLPEFQRGAFRRYADELAEKAGAAVYPDHLPGERP